MQGVRGIWPGAYRAPPLPGIKVYCGGGNAFSGESVALGRFAVHSDGMSNSGTDERYYWCLRHDRVETGANLCAVRHRLGPYASATEAEHALERVRERNAAWDAEDARWTGEET